MRGARRLARQALGLRRAPGAAGDVLDSTCDSQDSLGQSVASSQPRRGSSSQVHPEGPASPLPSWAGAARLPALARAVPEEPITSWSQLPDEALELVFAHVHPGAGQGVEPTLTQRQVGRAGPLRGCAGAAGAELTPLLPPPAQAMYSACTVCRAWRRVGLHCFFRQLDAALPIVHHPFQLFRLVRPACPSACQPVLVGEPCSAWAGRSRACLAAYDVRAAAAGTRILSVRS